MGPCYKFYFLLDGCVVQWVGHDSNTSKVLGRSSQKSNTTNVDLFDSVFDGGSLVSNSFREGIKVADHHGNRMDPLRLNGSMIVESLTTKISLMSDSASRAKIPAWTAGWRVFTRPPSISGKLVISDTSLNAFHSRFSYLTSIPWSRKVFAVPPDATMPKPT